MAKIRIEWVPVQAFSLGLLGFDHLHLVYQQDDGDAPGSQDGWYVMEGVRDPTGDGALLGIEGADGRTTLAAANVAAREELIAKIGTPAYRGSRSLPFDGEEFRAWETMASVARDIERQDFPYIAYALPGSPTPTINSSSAIASLIHYSGLDPSARLPFGVHLSPGYTTLLGTSGDDTLRAEHGFTTLLGGLGRDELIGGFETDRIDKLYGGEGDDLFHWSSGFNIVHGGQPQLGYAADGTDVIDYSGAGTVTISFNRHWIAHKVPTYVARFENGRDHLFSIERIQWNEITDRIVLGNDVSLVEDDVILSPRADADGAFAPRHMRSGLLVPVGDVGTSIRSIVDHELAPDDRSLELAGQAVTGRGNAVANRLIGNGMANRLEGLDGDDTLYGGGGDDLLIGGAGSDGYVYVTGDGNDVIIDDGPASDSDALVLAGGIGPGDVAVYRPAASPGDLGLALAGGGRIEIRNFAAGDGIERVLFDDAPPLSREELQSLAEVAPLLDGDRSGPSSGLTADWPEVACEDGCAPIGPYFAAIDGWLF